MKLVEDLLENARDRLAERDFRAAHELCLRALAQDERCAGAFYLLAQLALEHNNAERAAGLAQLAIERQNDAAPYYALRARALISLRRDAEALQAAERAYERLAADETALTLDTIGVVFSHLGHYDRALPLFERAVALTPANDRFQHNLGIAAQFSGDFDRAEQAFRAELESAPRSRRPYAALVTLRKQTAEANYIPELESQFAAEPDEDARLQLGHALAKAHEDLVQYDEALAWLQKAKAPKAERLGDFAGHARRLFNAAAEISEAPPAANALSEAPIFIVGMPRTGTTLLDRIISSHPDVEAAGELGHFARLSTELAKPHATAQSDIEIMRAGRRLDPSELGAAYLAAARSHLSRSLPRFTDKMPLNFLYAGLILRALPNARIVCLRRDPMDTCLSNYRQLFGPNAAHYWYSYSLSETARYYAQFDALIARWRETLPADRFIETQYETIVDDLEGETRRLIAFCGLDWNDRCLDFQNNSQAVATPSAIQVRSPIYSSSIGRWRRYGSALDPLKTALDAEGISPVGIGMT